MKKFISMMLILVLSLSMVACGNKADEPKDPEEVTDGEVKDITEKISVQAEPDWKEYYEAAVERVKETYPNAEIEIKVTDSFDHLDVLDMTDVTNEDIADVFSIPADRIYGLSQNEALAGLNAKEMAENLGGFDNYDEGLGGNFNIEGDYLAFPMNVETLIIFANKANAEAKGIDLTQNVELTELDAEDMLIPVFDAWFGVALTNSVDIELLEKDDSGNLASDLTQDFNDLPEEKQKVFEMLYEYWSGHDELGTALWDKEAAWGYMDTAFTTGGNNSMRLEGPWSTESLSNLASEGEDLEILPINMTTLNGNPLKHWKSGWGLSVNSRIEGEEDKMVLAEKLIEEIVNPEYAIDFFKATGKIMENVPADVYADSDLSDSDKEVVEAVLESYEDATARPLFTEWGQVWDTWENSVLSWSSTKPGSAEEAYNEVKASFDAMMENF